jgi:cell wall-associated NlpC family hydrolase
MRSTPSSKRRLAVAGVTAIAILAAAVPAAAQTGGSGPPGGTTTTTTTDPSAPVGPPGRAKLRKDGTALAPSDAPANIQAAIAAGNAIHTYPYHWGGGHRSFTDTGYDCSGAVSYVLHAAGFLSSPMPSGPLASSWGTPGKGRWITVYANASHAYMVVAGLRFDTSAVGERLNQGSGPRWRKTKRKATGYTAKFYPGY